MKQNTSGSELTTILKLVNAKPFNLAAIVQNPKVDYAVSSVGKLNTAYAQAQNTVQKYLTIRANTGKAYITYVLVDQNGRVYVGCTKDPLLRWMKAKYMYGRIGSALVTANSLTSVFTIIPMNAFADKMDALKDEEALISEFDSCQKVNGFNVWARGSQLSTVLKAKPLVQFATKSPNHYSFVAKMTDGFYMFSSQKDMVKKTGCTPEYAKKVFTKAKLIKR